MNRDDWSTLVPEWKLQPGPDVAILLDAVMRKQRWRKFALAGELFGTVAALALTAFALREAPSVDGMRNWYLGSAAVVIVWQVCYVLIRRRFGVFQAPQSGLVGLFDAEIRHARYLIAHLWFGVLGGLVLAAWAMAVMPSALVSPIRAALLLAAAWCVPYAIVRSRRAMRWIARLGSQRDQLLR
jgi:hypothetical protein